MWPHTENKDKFNCECCDLKTDTKYNLKQNVNGQHGRGVKAKCGQCMKWKSQLAWNYKNVINVESWSDFIYK